MTKPGNEFKLFPNSCFFNYTVQECFCPRTSFVSFATICSEQWCWLWWVYKLDIVFKWAETVSEKYFKAETIWAGLSESPGHCSGNSQLYNCTLQNNILIKCKHYFTTHHGKHLLRSKQIWRVLNDLGFIKLLVLLWPQVIFIAENWPKTLNLVNVKILLKAVESFGKNSQLFLDIISVRRVTNNDVYDSLFLHFVL